MNNVYPRYNPQSSSPAGDGKLYYICEVDKDEAPPAVGDKIVISGCVMVVKRVDDFVNGNAGKLGMKHLGITI